MEGASKYDGEMLETLGFARGFALDKDKIYVFDKDSKTIAEYDRCGY